MLEKSSISTQLFAQYAAYAHPASLAVAFDPQQLAALLPAHKSLAGRSAEGRPLHQIDFGEGKTRVLLWTQMHGDEPTATLAALDVFRFLSEKDNFWKPLRTQILEQLHLRFLPLINPDGALRKQRRTAWQIDPNRDYIAQVSPEAQFLRKQSEIFRPQWGFNLHDQNRFYAVGQTQQSPILTLLAPLPHPQNTDYQSYQDAVGLIALLHDDLQELLAGRISRYADDFEGRAFGDNFQRTGIRTVLFEGGFIFGDQDYQQRRQYFAVALLTALALLADPQYYPGEDDVYQKIPRNETRFFDVFIPQLRIAAPNGIAYNVDIGSNQLPDGRWEIMDIGDLQSYTSHTIWPDAMLRPNSAMPICGQKGTLEKVGDLVTWTPINPSE
ncbi:MAG: M14 family zinc carboxypeptidase [Bernardetiaceae bacterium]